MKQDYLCLLVIGVSPSTSNYAVRARIAARRPVTAWKPLLMFATDLLDPQVSHCKKNNRVSFCKIVSGDRQV